MSEPNTRREPHRPQYHYTSAKNWLNDPNGLVWFEGEYHLFYQYNPFGDQWGHMSWGHAVSTDLVHWQELPVAIAEDERVSIFSGSVVVDTNNTSGFGDGSAPPLVAIYTGCLRVPQGGQVQELAYSNDRGRTWARYAGNPVLDLGLRDFRDPKVFWHQPTSRWIMLVALAHEYRLAFYASPDLKSWELLSHFEAADRQHGIWECPDIFMLPVAGEAPVWVMKVDVLEGHPSQGSGARLFFGQFDGIRFMPFDDRRDRCSWADFGADFYAAISWANLPLDNQVWIGWMNCHRYAKFTPTAPWRGAMSLPREIFLRRTATGLQFHQQPVRALQSLRGEPVRQRVSTLQDGAEVLAITGADRRALEIELRCEHSDATEWGLLLRASHSEETRVGYDSTRGTVFIDRRRAGFAPDDPHFAGRREAACRPPAPGTPLRLQVFIDWSSVEVFADDGAVVLTEQIFPDEDSQGVLAYSRNGSTRFGHIDVWPLSGAFTGESR